MKSELQNAEGFYKYSIGHDKGMSNESLLPLVDNFCPYVLEDLEVNSQTQVQLCECVCFFM